MSRAKRASRPRKASKTARPAESFASALGMSEEGVIMLMAEALRGSAGLFNSNNAVALFAEYLEGRGSNEGLDEEQSERIADLISELNDLRIDCNGGDRKAREDVRAIHDLLHSALDDGTLGPIDLIMTGKVFHDAGWAVPDRLKEAVAQALQSGTGGGSSAAAGDLSSLLPGFLESVGSDPFDIHEFVCSILAAVPSEACGHFLSAFAAFGRPEVSHALAGFVVHPDAIVARAATDALRTLTGHAPVESLLVDRLVQMRPWLPQDRQVDLDPTIRALRQHASPLQERFLPELVGCYVSVRDGSGASSVALSQRTGSQYRFASVMMKPSGVSEVVVIPGLSKSDMERLLREVKSSVHTGKTDAAGIARMLRLALADNSASAILPPFRLIDVVESLGLPPLHPDHASASEIVDELLAGLPQEQTDASAAAKAHADLLEEEFIEHWFEAGEALENLLHPLKTFNKRMAAVITAYLPRRRQFWARQCAISALALRTDARHSSWKQLALVGRDMASDLPLDRIPLMKQIATASVRAFELQA